MDEMNTEIQPPAEEGDTTIALFLGLYLVVLAFFILLVTISTLEESKSQKVMDSLSTAFTSIVPPSATLQVLKSKDGDVLAGQEFQQQITGIFATELGVDKVETVQPGRQMRLLLKSDSLFFEGEDKIRPAKEPFLNRAVAAMSSPPGGLRYDMEFVIGTPTLADGKTMPIAQTLEVKRAGAFARAMNALGIPPGTLSVGMRPGHEGEIVIWFYTRDIEADKLRFTTPSGAGQ